MIGETAWLVSGIKIEESQLELSQTIRGFGPSPNKAQSTAIMEKRDRLLRRLDRFHEQALHYIGLGAVELMKGVLDDPGHFDLDGMGAADEHLDGGGGGGGDRPETVALPLPSLLEQDERQLFGMEELTLKELKIRQGQANDSLHALRLLLGKKSFEFRERLRPAIGKVQKTRAWAAIQATNAEISHYARIYTRNREAMIRLGLNQQELDRLYRPLTSADLVTSTAILQPNLPGQSQHMLSWIWTHHLPPGENNNHLSECM
jgi:hypothetical protein